MSEFKPKYVFYRILWRNFHKLIIDTIIAFNSFWLAIYIREDLNQEFLLSWNTVMNSLVFVTSIIFFGLILGLYRGKYKTASIDEVLALNTVGFLSCTINLTTRVVFNIGSFPRSVPIISALIFVLLSLFIRTLYRFYYLQKDRTSISQKNLLIYGAGALGLQLANLVKVDQKIRFIGFIDDDPYKSPLVINGKSVLTDLNNLEACIRKYKINQILIAITNLEQRKIDILVKICGNNRVNLKSIRSSSQILLGIRNLEDLISLNQEVLMGREQVSIDREAIRKLIRGKSILITGAGGSIGSEIAKQCATYGPSEILILDRDESALHSLELELFGTGSMNHESIFLSDIRDKSALEQIFKAKRPQIVFHAAALKHLPILEKFPDEATKTNVEGTRNVLELSHIYSAEIFVNISTDKAADPSSILGKTKMKSEQLTLSYATQSPNSKYISVRFGNVIGSRGSVMHTFKFQIDHDLPVTVTDPEATRYFMTIKEAVELVLQSSVIGENGEILILDMGTPVKIEEVAKFMISQSGKDLPINYTGLRPGEKLHEVLNSKNENLENRFHPKIYHTNSINGDD